MMDSEHAGRSRLRRTGLVTSGMALVAAAATVAGIAVAGVARPASRVIHGCVNTKTRALTIPSGSSCPAGTVALRWNAQGPLGPQGPAGPAGPAGWGVVFSGPRYQINDPRALVSDGTNIWVANTGSNSVTEINAATGAFVRKLSGGSYNFSGPSALAFDGTHIWVANQNNNSLTEVNASDGRSPRTCPAAVTTSTPRSPWPSTARTSG
jgi:hypothetical protein